MKWGRHLSTVYLISLDIMIGSSLNFTTDVLLQKKVSTKFWRSSGSDLLWRRSAFSECSCCCGLVVVVAAAASAAAVVDNDDDDGCFRVFSAA